VTKQLKKTMKILEANDLLEKLKRLENQSNTKNGFPIHRFFILPIKYFRENNLEIDWYKLWENDNLFKDLTEDTDIDFQIVAVHRSSYGTFWTSTDIEHFKTLLQEQ
ncbi:hypothetical protein, partial [Bizionia myxarmorum]